MNDATIDEEIDGEIDGEIDEEIDGEIDEEIDGEINNELTLRCFDGSPSDRRRHRSNGAEGAAGGER